jgi:hypothetical protein
MANAVIGAGFDGWVQSQIDTRQRINGTFTKTPDIIQYQNNNNAFLRLTSGIDVLGSADLARQYQLYSTRFGGEFAAGVGLGSNTAYGWNSNAGYGYVPPPGLISADIKSQNRGSLKEATINMMCHNKIQFDIISKLYLRIGYSMLLEWGWRGFFHNDQPLIDGDTRMGQYRGVWSSLDSDFLNGTAYDSTTNKLVPFTQELVQQKIQSTRKDNCGNFDAIYGRVVNYSWSLEKDGSYNISLILKTWGDVTESLKSNVDQPATDNGTFDPNSANDENQPPLSLNQTKSTLNRILWQFTKEFLPDNPYDYVRNGYATKAVDIGTKIGITPSQENDDVNSQYELMSFTFPQLKGVEKSDIAYKNEYYVRLGCLLRTIQNFILLYNPDTEYKSIINMDYDSESNFMFTYPRQCSLDPRVCLIQIPEQILPEEEDNYIVNGTSYTWNSLSIRVEGALDSRDITNTIVYDPMNSLTYTIINNERDTYNIEDILSYIDVSTLLEISGKPLLADISRGLSLDIEQILQKGSQPNETLELTGIIDDIIIESTNFTGVPIPTVKKGQFTEPISDINNVPRLDPGVDAEDIQANLEEAIVDNTVKSFLANYQNEWTTHYEGKELNYAYKDKQIVGPAKENTVYVFDSGMKPIETKTYTIQGRNETFFGNNKAKITIYVNTHQAKFGEIVNVKNNYIADYNVAPPDQSIKDVFNNTFEKLKGTGFRVPNYDYIGRTMNIMVNCNYLAQTLQSNIDAKTGALSLFDFLDNMMTGIQEALGNINSFNVIYNEDRNTTKIIDSTYIPQLNQYKPELFSGRKMGEFITHTLDPGKGSFVRDASIKTKLSNNFAAMTTIGAQANGNVVGENATALSKWNTGLTDRIIGLRTHKNPPSGSAEDSYASNVGKLLILNNGINDGNISDETIDACKSGIVDLFKYELGTLDIPGIGFLPIDLELTMDGLSGIKIYETYTADTRLLPDDYKDKIQFITTGVSHKIQNNDWTTTISSVTSPRYAGIDIKNPTLSLSVLAKSPSTDNKALTSNSSIASSNAIGSAIDLTPTVTNATKKKLIDLYGWPVVLVPGSIKSQSIGKNGTRNEYKVDQAYVSKNVITVTFEGKKYRCHKIVKDALEAVLKKLKSKGLLGYAKIDCVIYPRDTTSRPNQDNTGNLSGHSFGLALDVNSDKFPLGNKQSYLDAVGNSSNSNHKYALVVKEFIDSGYFFWGGSYNDPHHFSIKPYDI